MMRGLLGGERAGIELIGLGNDIDVMSYRVYAIGL